MSKDKKTPAARSLKLLPPEKKANERRSLGRQRRHHAWIKTGICYNLNNCAADEFKILQSYLLVENKALDYYSGRLSLSRPSDEQPPTFLAPRRNAPEGDGQINDRWN